MNYPLYRKYSHNRTFFKVLSPEEFEELQIIGHHYSIHHIKAKILPDRNFIYDLIFDYQRNWEEITETEYTQKLQECMLHFKRLV